jgi:NADPH-dependent 2,4-dienoyl-CoA reductase/sulfur reductase-like enzyme/rhodanese-related sulfurtransferase
MTPMKLVIIGGVAGGATAAARARRLSETARIVVLERGPYVSFANCGLPYHIGGEIADRGKLLLQTPQSLKARHNLDVRVRHAVLSIDRAKKEVVVRDLEADRTYRERYDKLIIATGATPIRPPLPGIDHPRIFTLRNIPDTDTIKKAVDEGAKSAIVIGGGFIGLEMAENLRRRGLAVHLVEMLDQVMPPLDREMATAIHQELLSNGVQLHLSDAVEAFAAAEGRVSAHAGGSCGTGVLPVNHRRDAGATVSSRDGLVARLKSGALLTADFVVLAIGIRPESKLAAEAGLQVGERGAIVVDPHMRTGDPDIYAVGDAVQTHDLVTGRDTLVPLAGPANRQGRIAADHVFGRGSTYRGSQGTSVVRIFDLTAAMTGAGEKALGRAGIDYEKVYLHPVHHVTYYPGADAMHLKLLFRQGDGRVLGAQITGRQGVDKRIDVLATAIQAGMTVYDLEQAELAYAPQFGAAKDPINMAGFIAANVLRGDVKIVHADRLDHEAVLLDVRDPAEHQAGAIPGAILIPVNELRARHGELPKGKRIQAYCAVGLRGYLASRILSQLGYEVCNLSGGYKTYRAFFPEALGA